MWLLDLRGFPLWLLGVAIPLVAVAIVSGTHQAEVEGRILLISLVVSAGFFALTLIFQVAISPYRLYREAANERDQLKRELDRLRVSVLACAVVVEEADAWPMTIGGGRKLAKYVKVKVTAKTREVKNCRPSITSIRRIIGNVEDVPAVFEPVFLRWSAAGEEVIEIRPGVDRYFDVVLFAEAGGPMRPRDVKWSQSLNGLFDSIRGTYVFVFVVAIESDGPTQKLGIEVVWNGNWKEVSARQIDVT